MEFKRDPIEKSIEYLNAMIKVTAILDNEMGGYPRKAEFSDTYWERKKELLAQHGIDWKTPAELNELNTI